MFARFVVISAFTLLAGFSTSPLGAQAVATKAAPPKIEAIDQAMQTFVDEGKISGAVTLVAHQGKVIHLGAVGLRDIEQQKPMQPRTAFSIASMTKPITATAVMILQDEGKL
ncbi:MAG: beta-lactamase family protein, partial [Planctomycetes bacterium]|nr:beta-lactamase family protein [Planctomycetota bacterium]